MLLSVFAKFAALIQKANKSSGVKNAMFVCLQWSMVIGGLVRFEFAAQCVW
jgi:hypothetical protein